MPRLVVLLRARWSRNDGGENCLQGARSGFRSWTGRGAHAKYGFKARRDMPQGGNGLAFRSPAILCQRLLAARPGPRANRRRQRHDARCRPAVGRIGTRGLAAHGKLSERPSSPSGISPHLTSPCPARCCGAVSGARRNFATGAFPDSRLDRPAELARLNSLYQCSVTVGATPTERACGRRPCRLVSFRACNSLLLVIAG